MSSVPAKPQASASGRMFRFGAFEYHLPARELWKHGLRIKLTGQPISVLAMLLERPGEVVTREELQKRLWPAGTYVDFEHSVNAAVKRLRQTLNDSADSPRFIETVARSGYRFIAPVSERIGQLAEPAGQKYADEPPPAAHAKESAKWLRFVLSPRVMAGVLLVILIAGSIIGLHERRPTHAGSGPIRSLAVLPLANLSGDPNEEYFVAGMADSLRQHLEIIRPLRVISRTSSMYYRGSSKPLPEIARQLNADAVVEGSVLRSGNDGCASTLN